MKRIKKSCKFLILINSFLCMFLFSSQSVFASDFTDDFYRVQADDPFLLLLDNVSIYNWYLYHNRANLPTNGIGIGWWNGSEIQFPFIIEKDTPVNSLYVADDQKIGFNTNTPAEELQIVAPFPGGLIGTRNPASVRLTGYGLGLIGTLTSWDINGHITSFGIEDTNAGHEVFKIEGGAPEDTLVLRSAGGVASDWSGMQSGGDGLKKLMALTANNADASVSSDAGFTLRNERANFLWNFRTAEFVEGFMATKEGSKGPELQISNPTDDYRNVSMELGNGASCTSTGQWLNASSRDYKENIRELTGGEVMEAFRQLKPVSYNFKKDEKKDATIGFIAEDVPNLVATEDRKGLNSLEIVALLTKVVQEQQTQIEAQQKAIQQLEEKFQTSQTVLPPSATLTGWQPMNQQQVPGSL